MSHSPKRISIACTYCRYRKRKCDGQTPQCRTCRVKGLRCKYLDPEAEKEEEGPPHQTQAQRLDVIESLLHQQSEYLDALRQQIPQKHSSHSNEAHAEHSRSRSSAPTGSSNSTYISAYNSPLSAGGVETDSSSLQDKNEKISPPAGHLNAHPSSLSDLLKLPQVCQLIGSYSEEFFLRIENSRERLQMANGVMEAGELEIDEETVNACFVNFSKLVHPFHPFLECKMSFARYNEVMARGIKSDSDSAFALAILALGASAADPIDHGKNGTAYSGDLYIQRCLKIILPLWSVSFTPDIMICETLLLCALYFAYTVDPLMTRRFANMASISIKQAMDCSDKKLETETAYIFMRLSWVSFVIERDTQLESNLLTSNIARNADEIPLPGYQGSDFPRSFFALADISAHIILERLLDTLESLNQKRIEEASPTMKCPDPQGRIAGELNHQLEAWYNALPEPIKPDLTGAEKGNKQQCQLRLRYWNIKQIINRPLVIYATSPDYEGSCYSALEAICACIEACRNYVYNAHHILSVRTPYTYCVIQSCFASVITLAVAAQEQVLKQHVGDFPAIIKEAQNVISPWAQGDSSVKALYDIMTVLSMKVQYGS